MNRTEYLLTQAASECNEVAHRITKALHFGLDEVQPGQPGEPESNAERIVCEYIDLLASVEMLIEDAALTMPSAPTVRALIAKKKAKVEYFMGYARDNCGTLLGECSVGWESGTKAIAENLVLRQALNKIAERTDSDDPCRALVQIASDALRHNAELTEPN